MLLFTFRWKIDSSNRCVLEVAHACHLSSRGSQSVKRVRKLQTLAAKMLGMNSPSSILDYQKYPYTLVITGILDRHLSCTSMIRKHLTPKYYDEGVTL